MTPSREMLLHVTNDLSEVTKCIDELQFSSKGGHGEVAARDAMMRLSIYMKYHHSLMMIADMIGINTYTYKR